MTTQFSFWNFTLIYGWTEQILKKFLCILLTLFTMGSLVFTSFAIEIDYSSLTDEELDEIIQSATIEKNSRKDGTYRSTQIKTSPDKYTWYIQDYVGKNLASVGYSSLGGDRLDTYGNGHVKLIPVTLDGRYLDIEDEKQLQQYVVTGQSVKPNSELKISFQTLLGEESNIVDTQSIETIDLLVKRLDGNENDLGLFNLVEIGASPDKYTSYIRNYVGKNAALIGYYSLGGDRLDGYGNAYIKIIYVSDDGTFFDPSDSELLSQYVVTNQDVPVNTELKCSYMKTSTGEELSNIVDTQSINSITLYVKKLGSTDTVNTPSESIDNANDVEPIIEDDEQIEEVEIEETDNIEEDEADNAPAISSIENTKLREVISGLFDAIEPNAYSDISVFMDDDDSYYAELYGCADGTYEKCVDSLKSSGFNLNMTLMDSVFYGENSSEVCVSVVLAGDVIIIDAYK